MCAYKMMPTGLNVGLYVLIKLISQCVIVILELLRSLATCKLPVGLRNDVVINNAYSPLNKATVFTIECLTL